MLRNRQMFCRIHFGIQCRNWNHTELKINTDVEVDLDDDCDMLRGQWRQNRGNSACVYMWTKKKVKSNFNRWY